MKENTPLSMTLVPIGLWSSSEWSIRPRPLSPPLEVVDVPKVLGEALQRP